MKKLICVLVMFLVLTGLSGCKKTEGLIEEGVIKIATSPDYAPYEFVDISKSGMDKYLGSDIELMKYIAEQMGVKLVIEEMAFDACLMAVQTQKVDIAISGFSWTPKRSESFEMSKGYFGEGDGEQQLLILKKNADKFKSLADVNNSNVKVGAQAGSIQEEYVDVQLPKANKTTITDLDVALSLLLSGSLDAIAISEHVAEVRIASHDNLTVVKENFETIASGFVVVGKKGNTKLIDEINEYIDEVLNLDLYTTWLADAKAMAISLGQEINE